MKISKTFKKISAVIMAFAMLVGVAGGFGGEITAKASTNPVKMYYCDPIIKEWRGYRQYDVYIQIEAGSAATKEVYVHHGTGDSEWQDTQASFVTKLDANTEIWKATVSGRENAGTEYAIKYIGDGKTYWDNNNGNNYTIHDILGQANVKAERLSSQTASNYYIQAVVKNLAYNKVVKVRYTLDNWASYQDVNLSYRSSITGTNMERWGVTLNLNESNLDSFHYCISYEVNGQTYWDNNCGANYDRSFYRPL